MKTGAKSYNDDAGAEIKHSGWENAIVVLKMVVLYSKKALLGKTNIMGTKLMYWANASHSYLGFPKILKYKWKTPSICCLSVDMCVFFFKESFEIWCAQSC